MKNKAIVFTLILAAGLLFACSSKNDVKATFIGTIQEIRGDSALVDAAQEDGKVLGQIEINLSVNPNETFQIGDKVKIGYDGTIMETAPLKIITLTVEKIE
ncbi:MULTISPECIES: hypothetical protein [Sporosarcina]|uniref:hypothetical protein n=1 Tax=Sporosarcina TaxID=1569 RepID=UPI00129A5FBF|nr:MULTISPECIES: hypothetical protein [Sporosarcina]GKV67402.1 hypothetical protein NCCP2331_35550 [Sporosarcina sp. NCCP-2331]GLB57758.1 hypothetical protein NCCP2378_35490 [Sporosarcina sp. NCCP-2378]